MATTEIWSQLPEDVIKHIGEYWDDHKENVYRRIKHITEYMLIYQSCEYIKRRLLNPKIMLRKVMTLPFPEKVKHYIQTNEIPSGYPYRIKLPVVRITPKMCYITTTQERYYRGGTKQFNVAKHNDGRYNNWLNDELKHHIRDVLVIFTKILLQQYPEIHNIVWADRLKELKRQEEERVAKYMREEEEHRLEKEEYDRQEKERFRIFGKSIPKYITSL
jgi:hypothetical protein